MQAGPGKLLRQAVLVVLVVAQQRWMASGGAAATRRCLWLGCPRDKAILLGGLRRPLQFLVAMMAAWLP